MRRWPSHETTVLAADRRPAHLKKRQRPRPRMQWVGIVPESGQILTHHHRMFNKTDMTCRLFRETKIGCTRTYQIRGTCEYIIIIFLAKQAQQVHTASRE